MTKTRKPKTKSVLAWHFLPNDGRTRYSNEQVTVGSTLKVRGPIIPCVWGLHASKRLSDAMFYAPGHLLCRVRLWGSIRWDQPESDKLVARNRKVLAMADVTEVLKDFLVETLIETGHKLENRGDHLNHRTWACIYMLRDYRRGVDVALEQWEAEYNMCTSFNDALSDSGALRPAFRAVRGPKYPILRYDALAVSDTSSTLYRVATALSGEQTSEAWGREGNRLNAKLEKRVLAYLKTHGKGQTHA